jgi:hypothetical protein
MMIDLNNIICVFKNDDVTKHKCHNPSLELARLRTKKEAWESHLMLPRV